MYGISNGDGTICYVGMDEAQARRAAQREANERGETFYIFGPGVACGGEELGEPVVPAAVGQ